jgi:serine/threonine-protein kinase HipA
MADPTEAYVWSWLPGAVDPVVAGRLQRVDELVFFNYGLSYLDRPDAVPLYLPELPLRSGLIRPLDGLTAAGCIRDAAPDAWGQRVILYRRAGRPAHDADTADLGLLTYLLESGSNRIGALDFQASPTDYVPREASATLEEMITATDRVEAGEPFSADLDAALQHGTSIGGARPKVALADGPRHYIAKLSARTDPFPVVKAEAVAMALGRRVGLTVANTSVMRCLDHDVLLVERFDRTEVTGERRMIVSALTILGLDEIAGRYGRYVDLAEIMRHRFSDPKATARELFSRIAFNICVGNTDDHARNQAAFWDGETLTLTPAYDISPTARSGGEAAQAMEFAPGRSRRSRLNILVAAAPTYLLTEGEAQDIVDAQVEKIHGEWDEAAEEAALTAAERDLLWERQILNPFIFETDDDHR